jgi:hypothetical protein
MAMTRGEAHGKALDLARMNHDGPNGNGVACYFKVGEDDFDAAIELPDGVEWCATIYCTHDEHFE